MSESTRSLLTSVLIAAVAIAGFLQSLTIGNLESRIERIEKQLDKAYAEARSE